MQVNERYPKELERRQKRAKALQEAFTGGGNTEMDLQELQAKVGEGCLIAKHVYSGLARTTCKQCVYGVFGKEITKFAVMYGAYLRLWPTLRVFIALVDLLCSEARISMLW
jgi:hypothetical protein